jgi:hypothetical protein
MVDTGPQICFDAPATLRKWPSINNERVSVADGARPYLIVDGTLDDCIREFMAKHLRRDFLRGNASPSFFADTRVLGDFPG